MKVLKEGRDPNKWPKRVRCHNCDTEYEYERADCKWSDDYETRYVNCPVCGEKHVDFVDI